MMPLSNNGAGLSIGFPDPKMTPPLGAPIPYPNMAPNVLHVPFSPNIFVGYMPQQTMASTAPMTLGNQAGAMHPLFMLFGGQTTAKLNYLVNGIPAKHLLNSTYGNCFNNGVGVVAVPSVTTSFASDRSAPAEGLLDATRLQAFDAALSGSADAVAATQLADGVGEVHIRRFTRDAGTRFFNALRKLDTRHGLVLDLRDNPGGDSLAALEVAGDLLPKGAVLAIREQNGERVALRNRFDPSYDGPLVVLVDGTTASAAEVLAASLAHHDRATLLGARTHEKGTAQAVRQRGDFVVYQTVAEWFTPSGAPIHGHGVEPHFALAAE